MIQSLTLLPSRTKAGVGSWFMEYICPVLKGSPCYNHSSLKMRRGSVSGSAACVGVSNPDLLSCSDMPYTIGVQMVEFCCPRVAWQFWTAVLFPAMKLQKIRMKLKSTHTFISWTAERYRRSSIQQWVKHCNLTTQIWNSAISMGTL
jgi:hypothetical protein